MLPRSLPSSVRYELKVPKEEFGGVKRTPAEMVQALEAWLSAIRSAIDALAAREAADKKEYEEQQKAAAAAAEAAGRAAESEADPNGPNAAVDPSTPAPPPPPAPHVAASSEEVALLSAARVASALVCVCLCAGSSLSPRAKEVGKVGAISGGEDGAGC